MDVRCPQKDMISDYRRRHCGTVAVENSIMVSAKAIPMVDSKGGSGRFRSRCVTLASDTSLSRRQKKGKCEIEWISRDLMVADYLMKGLQGIEFQRF